MCGILGICNPEKKFEPTNFELALKRLQHRGPDAGQYLVKNNIWLGHRRLGIIDLSTQSNQPFSSTCGKYHIVFNGEIYNYKNLVDENLKRTSSDTETILLGYQLEGVSFFQKLRGIYAFAIYDEEKQLSILYRDPAGIKPLYYYKQNQTLIFSSEIKAILPLVTKRLSIDEATIKQYIHLGYCPEPKTAFLEINSLEPGTLLEWDHQNNTYSSIKINSYSFKTTVTQSWEVAINQTAALLKQAVTRNKVADVPLSVALSGGIDSSLIYAICNENDKNVKGLTVSFNDDGYDESNIAKAYAKHLDAPHELITVETKGKLDLLNQLLIHFDQPYADSSFVPFYFLTQKAAQHSRVLIGGDSGDEIQNGYAGYKSLPTLMRLRSPITGFILGGIIKTLGLFTKTEKIRALRKLYVLLASKSNEELHLNWMSWFPCNPKAYPIRAFKYETNYVFNKIGAYKSIHETIQAYYFKHRMQSDYLRKSDMMSMLNSVEFRVPMLDEDLTAYSLSLPYDYKSSRLKTKKIFKYLHQQMYPKEFASLPKSGFSIPLDKWLSTADFEAMKKVIIQNPLVDKYIEKEYIHYLFERIGLSDHYMSRASCYQRILILYSLALWYNQNQHSLLPL